MGIFDFLFGGNRSTVTVHPDRIWLTNRAKQNGIKKEILKQVGLHPGKLLLVAHFSDVLETLHELCGEISASCEVTLASELSTDLRMFDACDSETGYFILVAERHPLASHDNDVMQFAEELLCKCQIAFHMSLEDPLMKLFAGEWVENLLRQLGMAEDEVIESSMVSRRVTAAQKKIAEKSFGDSDAQSAAEWFEVNAPNMDA